MTADTPLPAVKTPGFLSGSEGLFFERNSLMKQVARKYLDLVVNMKTESKQSDKKWLKLKNTTSNANVSLK